MSTKATRRAGTALLLTGLLAAGTLGAQRSEAADDAVPATMPPVSQPGAGHVTADSLPTAQIGSGVVWTQQLVGDTVYAGGEFSTARPPGAAPGTGEVPRSNLLAYSISTGRLLPFSVAANRPVYTTALSPDRKRLYIGGAFTEVGGKARYRIAAIDVATGTVVDSFAPALDYNVKAIVATNDTVYVGGLFSSVKGQPRQRLAAFRASDGALTGWAPTADRNVQTMLMTPDGSKLLVGGNFGTINGQQRLGLAALDPTTGALVPYAATDHVKNGTQSAGITSLRTDGRYTYITGFNAASSGYLEGAVAVQANTGEVVWVEDCHGDSYDTYPASSGVLYVVTHAHYCGNVGSFWEEREWAGNTRRALSFTKEPQGTVAHNANRPYHDWGGYKAPSQYNWYPDLAHGDFTGQLQAAWSITGNDTYIAMAGEFPTVNGVGQQGLARFAVRPVAPGRRGPKVGGAQLKPRVTSPTTGTARIAFRGSADDDDATLTYRVYRDGNTATPVATLSRPSYWWDRRLIVVEDSGLAPGSGHTYRVSATDKDGNVVWGDTAPVTLPTTGAAGPYAQRVLADGATSYWRMGGTTGAFTDIAGTDDMIPRAGISRNVAPGATRDGDSAVTLNGDTANASLDSWVTPPQELSVELWVRTTSRTGGRVIGLSDEKSTTSYRHDRVLYLDSTGRVNWGVRSAGPNWYSPAVVTGTKAVNDGAWHHVVGTVGAAGMQLYVDGTLQATRADMKTAAGVAGGWRLGAESLSGWPNRPRSNGLSGSVDEVAIYPTQLSATRIANHVTLGRTGAGGANQAPAAAFTATPSDSQVDLDGTGSSDPDGRVVSYAWDFGDGARGAGEKATHTYAAAGTYTVRLTVTDDAGATATTTRSVEVSGVGTTQVRAQDAFGRTVTGGLGAADLGGAYTVSGAASAYSVADGQGRSVLGAPGALTRAVLPGLSLVHVDQQVDLSLDKAPAGSNVYTSVLARRSGSNDYRAQLLWRTDGRVSLYLTKTVAGKATNLTSLLVPGLEPAAGEALRVRMRTVGTAPTQLQVKVWKAGDPEPSAWTATATDSQPELAAAGATGVEGYLGATATNAPVTVRTDNLVVRQEPTP